MSPRNVSPKFATSNLSFKNLNTSEDKQFFKGIPTIMKKIMDITDMLLQVKRY